MLMIVFLNYLCNSYPVGCEHIIGSLTSFVKHALSLIGDQVLNDRLGHLLYDVLGVALGVLYGGLRGVWYRWEVIILRGSNSVFNNMFHLGHIWKKETLLHKNLN